MTSRLDAFTDAAFAAPACATLPIRGGLFNRRHCHARRAPEE